MKVKQEGLFDTESDRKEVIRMVGDFETTVYQGQEDTEVWASALVEVFTEDVKILHSIYETFTYLINLQQDVIVYYHNLKFDGSFWLDYIIRHLSFKPAYEVIQTELGETYRWKDKRKIDNNEYEYMISDMGAWYAIYIKYNGHLIELRDSLKLLPFSVKQIGEGFKTNHRKLEMKYEGYRYAGCVITDEEKKYIANDVLVVKEGLETLFSEGHDKLTIGSCCLSEYKNITGESAWNDYFPDLSKTNVPDMIQFSNAYKVINEDGELVEDRSVDRYIRNSYRGGWCYVVKGKENKIYGKGFTADVNSLYPSVMHSQSGNEYPVGNPHFWKGNYIPDDCYKKHRYFFIRIKTRFYIKKDMLPFIQIKGNKWYKGTEQLQTSDVYLNGKYYKWIKDKQGNLRDTRLEMTMTCTDYQLLLEHYDLVDFEILDGCWFYSEIGIFDEYIDKYKKIKMESKGAKRQLAKLFLNNLYGKMASSVNSSFKLAYMDEEQDKLNYFIVLANDKKAGYIPVGSAITSYARNFTIRSAQQNYYGVNEHGFIYADTDSIHCDIDVEKVSNELGITVDEYMARNGVPVHPTEFCHWKLESFWDSAKFVRQKTYIEHITHEDEVAIEKPYNNIKCAGMPNTCKQRYEKEHAGRILEDFQEGLVVKGKLMPRRMKGGIVLVESSYEMR